jgi:type IV pilus assembly protein PilA
MKKVQGFTLIELLIAMSIISILSAIAAPQFKSYRQKAYDSAVMSDIRATALAEESYMIDNLEYLSCTNESCYQLPGINKFSKGVTISVSVNEDRYIITGRHELGTKDYVWDSEEGGF